jgi:hypothetical protein
MSMSRVQLGRMIDAGRSSTLDCLTMLKDIHSESAGIEAGDAIGAIFQTPFLNECIFLKTVEAARTEAGVRYTVQNLLYFPYNHENVYEGGDSVFLSDPSVATKIAGKFGANLNDPQFREKYDGDQVILDLMGSLATFDPFLFKCKAQQRSLEDRIHPSFFNVDEREWKVLQAKIRGKIRALVERAFAGAEAADPGAIERQVTIFLNKIWEARDVEGIEDLVTSLGIPHDKAPDLFFAWKAICYYQTKYEYIKPSLRDFFAWFGGKSTALPSDFTTLAREEQDRVMRAKRILRQRLRENYQTVEGILADYEGSYRNFIDGGDPGDFKKFLSQADVLCDALAGGLAAFAHAINIQKNVAGKWGMRLRHQQHAEVLDSLLNIFGSHEPAAGGKAAGPAKAAQIRDPGMIGVTADPTAF